MKFIQLRSGASNRKLKIRQTIEITNKRANYEKLGRNDYPVVYYYVDAIMIIEAGVKTISFK